MLEFVDFNLYFLQDQNNFINPLLQVGSGSVEKSTGSGSGGPKINGSIRILIPGFESGYLSDRIPTTLHTGSRTTKPQLKKETKKTSNEKVHRQKLKEFSTEKMISSNL